MTRKRHVVRWKTSKAAARCNGREAGAADCYTRERMSSSSSMRVAAIQAIDIFIRGYYLECLDFLSRDICFWLGLKSAISSQAWAHQAASMWAKLRIYPGKLSFELRHSLNKVNDWGKMRLGSLKLYKRGQRSWRARSFSSHIIFMWNQPKIINSQYLLASLHVAACVRSKESSSIPLTTPDNREPVLLLCSFANQHQKQKDEI